MAVPTRELHAAALGELGVERLVLALQDVSFPSDPDEDIGRGAPTTRAADRLLAYAREQGFTGVQLGPQGQTSRANPSPYDGMVFSRHVASIAIASLRDGALAGLVSAEVLDAAVAAPTADGHAQHVHAWDASQRLVSAAYASFRAGARADLAADFAAFRETAWSWLERDALFAALAAQRPDEAVRNWPTADRVLWNPPSRDIVRTARRRAQLTEDHATAIERYAFGQFLAHREHARVRDRCGALGLRLYGDLQIGFSEADAWAYGASFLNDYVMGAPPSRTNPEGQPWNYPVIDPARYVDGGGELVAARAQKAFAEYDGLRIDHPHGLVCPWVYRAGQPDPLAAVQGGARLFESPDLPDHPALAKYAIARAAQLDRSQARYADGWCTELDDDQVARYAVLIDTIAAAAAAHGRSPGDLTLEVLSTLPLPLREVLERHGLGRWRITQKANLENPADVYRADLAEPADWVMLGNHDTASIFDLLSVWPSSTREAWGRHLAARLALPDPARLASPRFFASAMFSELLLSQARSVQLFYADLFGEPGRFNMPGSVSPNNWVLRLPSDFEVVHARRLHADAALDLPLAISLALRARGSTSGLADALAS